MNKKGFTLIELLATIIVLSIVVGITVVSVNSSLNKAKEKSEEVFVKTIHDALKTYIATDASKLSFHDTGKCVSKRLTGEKKLSSVIVSFENVINSSFHPITAEEMVNPANENKCNVGAVLTIYKDEDGVYYYSLVNDKSNKGLNCLEYTTNSTISNLPDLVDCQNN